MNRKYNRQAGYESFLSSQQKREDAAFWKDLTEDILPAISVLLDSLETAPNAKGRTFQGDTKPKAEKYWYALWNAAKRKESTYRAREDLKNLLMLVNSWHLTTGRYFAIQNKMSDHYGNARIIIQQTLIETSYKNLQTSY